MKAGEDGRTRVLPWGLHKQPGDWRQMNFEDDAECTVTNDLRYIENIVNWINNQSIFR